MRKESLIHKILRKLGFIKDIEDDREMKMEMCKRAIRANVCPEDCDMCAWDVKGGIDYNGFATGRNNRKPSEVSKKNQRADKKRGSSRARHEGGKTARS